MIAPTCPSTHTLPTPTRRGHHRLQASSSSPEKHDRFSIVMETITIIPCNDIMCFINYVAKLTPDTNTRHFKMFNAMVEKQIIMLYKNLRFQFKRATCEEPLTHYNEFILVTFNVIKSHNRREELSTKHKFENTDFYGKLLDTKMMLMSSRVHSI